MNCKGFDCVKKFFKSVWAKILFAVLIIGAVVVWLLNLLRKEERHKDLAWYRKNLDDLEKRELAKVKDTEEERIAEIRKRYKAEREDLELRATLIKDSEDSPAEIAKRWQEYLSR